MTLKFKNRKHFFILKRRNAFCLFDFGLRLSALLHAYLNIELLILHSHIRTRIRHRRGINALLVGPLISTLPLQKPFIYAGFQPRFRYIFRICSSASCQYSNSNSFSFVRRTWSGMLHFCFEPTRCPVLRPCVSMFYASGLSFLQ